MFKKIFIPMVILAVVAVSLLSCDNGGSDAGQLAGTWVITTTHDGGTTDFGDGSCTVSFYTTVTVMDQTVHIYIGTGTLNGDTWDVTVGENVTVSTDNVIFDFTSQANDNDWLDFTGTINGDGTSVSGNYDGWGIYTLDTGSFTATKQ
jgi:hypothetical protein